MFPYFHRGILMLIPFIICQDIKAQKHTLKIHLKDSATSLPLSKASVMIVGGKDSALVAAGITDTSGKYTFKNISLLKANALIITAAGYQDHTMILSDIPGMGEKNNEELSLDVTMSLKYNILEDITVMARSTAIRMVKDTIEFNADFFKTKPNDVLEDILRKLPGVEVREKGEVYVNGQKVNKILVDGKEFFSSDPLVILKNLPTEIIARIQVADEKNTIAKETRLQKDIPKTINIKLKKEMKKGVFGKVFGGMGTSDRYEAGGLVNVFRDTLQASIIGSFSNQGRGGFTMKDLNELGGFGRSGELGKESQWELSENNGSRGISTKKLGGVNLNYIMGKGTQLNAQYFHKELKALNSGIGYGQQFIADSILYSNFDNGSNDKQSANTIYLGLKSKQDSTGYLTTQLNFSFNKGRQQSFNSSKLASENAALLSSSNKQGRETTTGHHLSFNTDYSKTFIKPGIDWNLNVNLSNNKNLDNKASSTYFIQPVVSNIPDSVMQLREDNMPDSKIFINIQLSKTWKDKHTFSYDIEYSIRKEGRGGNTYERSTTSGKDELNPLLSISVNRKLQRIANKLSYRFNYESLTLTTEIIAINHTRTNTYSGGGIANTRKKFDLIAPLLSIDLKGINFSISSDLEEPNTWYISPVIDNSNPLSVIKGNPELKPKRQTRYTLSYNKYFDSRKISLNTYTFLNKQKDAVVSSTIVDQGKTITEYVNTDKTSETFSYLSIGKSYNKNKWSYNLNSTMSIQYQQMPVLVNNKNYDNRTYSTSFGLSGLVNWDNKIKWQPSYSISSGHSKTNDSLQRASSTTSHRINNFIHIQVLPKLSFDVNANYTITPGTGEGFKKSWLFLDMALTYSLLKKDQGQIKLSGFDILNQNQGLFRYTYRNYIYTVNSLVQKQYFMLTFLYSLKKF